MAKPLDPSQSLVARYGAALREHRLRRGWSQAKLGRKVFLSHARIAQFEAGQSLPSKRQAEALDDVLGAGGALLGEWDRVNDNPDAKWIQKLAQIENRAVEIRHLTDVIPALLQSEGYARAILAQSMEHYGGDLEQKMQHRTARRALLDRPGAPKFYGVLKEAALHWVVGGAEVMRGQLRDLADMAAKPHISIQVVPFVGCGLLTDIGMLTISKLPSGKDIVYRSGAFEGTYITRRDAVAQYLSLYERLRRSAMSPDDSMKLIEKVLGERYS
ncbi:Scr1 family TA system antitoxin-like transcriptional regulator [Streptomyces luteireticuli]|uniref:helix-turn-helix domain-containing protein n=1 Tax=Streptomyces luteireticuli TaxID=173858 RepID=UPI0035575D48